jgi:uncharacterized protein with NAD-binding domain and iron-sulfur cluster
MTEKIAILGGGLGSLAAAFELTNLPDHAERFDITLYQVGHRLGGKGASGRNAAREQRIEEHGLHIFLGFYWNAFAVLRQCYEELGRPKGAPLATLEDAFKPQNFIYLAEQVDGVWQPWEMHFPEIAGTLGGEVKEPPRPFEQLGMILDWLFEQIADDPKLAELSPFVMAQKAVVDQLFDPAERALDDVLVGLPRHLDAGSLAPSSGLHVAQFFTSKAHELEEDVLNSLRGVVVKSLRAFRTWAWSILGEDAKTSTPLRRLLWLLDLGLTVVLGGLEDRVDTHPDGWFSLDEQDLSAWLLAKGANAGVVASVLTRSLYNLMFTPVGRGAAGTMIHATLQIIFNYRGGVFNKMQAGMGDTIFGPLYEVLKKRGVKFRFFHRVDELVVSADKKSIDAIKVGVQVEPIAAEYEPLVNVLDLPCWPSEPRYELLEQGADLKKSGENLESSWNAWKDVGKLELARGKDFDRVVLGISIGAFPYIAKQLIDASPRFKDMVDHIETKQTQALQLWLAPDLPGIGWDRASPVLDGFASPFDTWADMTHLLPREQWSGAGAPKTLAYVCTSLEDDMPPPPPGPSDYPERQAARVKANSLEWLNASAADLWPKLAGATPGTFAWDKLVDRDGGVGEARLASQYWQATYSHSERYVRVIPGSWKYRLHADESGFDNLVLAGDWLKTGVAAGCAESAVQGGLEAARVILGTR